MGEEVTADLFYLEVHVKPYFHLNDLFEKEILFPDLEALVTG